MTLAAGSRLGPYEILAPLGAGGMGEVFRARDTKLGREVALKVLPQALAQDAERLGRFEREAQLLAALNHPHIAAIYGVEDSTATKALVLELVEGETLQERIERGPVPLEDALAIARQIAEALEAAHERGVIHRDLKPANVKITAEGAVKVLDFGLAKALDPGVSQAPGTSPTLQHSPTLTAAGTQLGVILGTAAYMAPEQAKGLSVDKRADIWAFGVVVYEMLTGRAPFTGDSVAETLAGVLKSDVDFTALPATTPRRLRELLRRCLARQPKERLHDIADARLVLAEIRPDEAETPVVASASAWRRWLPWAVALLGVAAGVAGFVRPRAGAPVTLAAAPTTRFSLLPSSAGEIVGYPALSPDGRSLAFCLVPERGVAKLWLHSFDTGRDRELPGTDNAADPFWSPDGLQLAFFAAGELRRIEVESGLVQSVARVSDARGGTWSERGEIIFSPTSSAPLSSVSIGSSEVRTLTRLREGEQSHRFPWVLPGGDALLYTAGFAKGSGIHWFSLRTHEDKLLVPVVSRAAYDPRGFLLWSRKGALVAQRFDPERGEASGESFIVAERVGVDPQKSAQNWFAAASGIVALRVGSAQQTQLRWLDRQGQPALVVTSPGSYVEPALSFDGSRGLAQLSKVGNLTDADIWVFDVAGKDRGTRLTFDGNRSSPTWSADGRLAYYQVDTPEGHLLVSKRVDGGGAEELVYRSAESLWPDSYSPKEPLLVLEGRDAQGGYRLWLLSLQGEPKLRPFQQDSSGSQAHATFSPDGNLIAYVSDESGASQIYVQPVEGSGVRWQVSTGGGDLPTWRRDGKELFYVGLDRVLRAVPIRSLAPFANDSPQELFPLAIPLPAITGNHAQYQPSVDGQRFLINTILGASSEPGVEVTMNWAPPASSSDRRP